MSVTDKLLTPAAVRKAANEWYDRQCEIAAQCMGDSWAEHREWVEDYLREELRQRLIDIGWRPTDGRR